VAEADVGELAALAKERGIPLVEDLGSGTLGDFTADGLPSEAFAPGRLRLGVDVVCFSGDKLIGGPQAGILLGRRPLIDAMRANPLARALRIDKLTSAALDATLERRMSTVRAVSTLGRRVREDFKIKVRQPLRELTVVHRDESVRNDVVAASALIASELNVKTVSVEKDESAVATVTVKPNFKTLGKRCGPKLKEIGPVLANWGFEEVSRLEAGESILVAGEELRLEDVLFQRAVAGDAASATDGVYTVVLDTALDEGLRREGIARDTINLLNNLRKEKGFEISDRIRVRWSAADADLRAALEVHAEMISREVLATEFASSEEIDDGADLELGGATLRYSIKKA
jgi:isoleucyl-tRNA synthetase